MLRTYTGNSRSSTAGTRQEMNHEAKTESRPKLCRLWPVRI